MSTSIWFNRYIATNNLYFSDWYKHGILVIGDIVNLEGNMFTLDELRQKFKFKIKFLNYLTVKNLY